MHRINTIIAAAAIGALTTTGCSKGEAGEKSGAAASCDERNDVQIAFAADEEGSPGAFELKKTLGYTSGMATNGKTVARHAYVTFANYDATLGSYFIDMPKQSGQIAVQISFKTDDQPATTAEQKKVYAGLSVPTGSFEPGWMKAGKSFQVSYFLGGSDGGPSISGDTAKGTATLTASSSDRVCGSIDFTSAKGTTIKGTFNVPLEKDLWQ